MSKVVSFFNWRGRCSAANNLGQLVTDDIYNCYAIYCVQQLNANFEYGQRPKLGVKIRNLKVDFKALGVGSGNKH